MNPKHVVILLASLCCTASAAQSGERSWWVDFDVVDIRFGYPGIVSGSALKLSIGAPPPLGFGFGTELLHVGGVGPAGPAFIGVLPLTAYYSPYIKRGSRGHPIPAVYAYGTFNPWAYIGRVFDQPQQYGKLGAGIEWEIWKGGVTQMTPTYSFSPYAACGALAAWVLMLMPTTIGFEAGWIGADYGYSSVFADLKMAFGWHWRRTRKTATQMSPGLHEELYEPLPLPPTHESPTFGRYSGVLRDTLAPTDLPEKLFVTIKVRDYGTMKVELHTKDAPLNVTNVANNAIKGFYDGLTFHRVVPGFVIQGGDPNGDGTGGPGYTVPAEIKRRHEKGAIAMARAGDEENPNKESSGSQFYICLESLPMLDGEYTVIGQVVEGMEVLEEIGRVSTDANDRPLKPVVIELMNAYVK